MGHKLYPDIPFSLNYIFHLHLIWIFNGFNLIYWTTMSGSNFLMGSNLEKCGNFWKNGRFFRADMAGFGIYHMGGFGQSGVHRVKVHTHLADRRQPIPVGSEY